MKDWRWINVFARDAILAALVVWVNFKVDYRSWWAAFILGMIVVLISWHFSEFIEEKRRLI